MKKTLIVIGVIFVLALILLLLGPFYILSEGEQSVVTRFGAIVNVETEPGLKFKMPFVDTVTKYSHEVGYGLLALVVLAIAYLIIKSKRKKKREAEEHA